jgi:hypothetical protein
MMARFDSLIGALALALLTALPARSETPASYAGSAAGADCQAAETKAWSASDHAWALKEPDAQSILGDFNDQRFTHKGLTSRFFMQDGKYFVETDGASCSAPKPWIT